MSAATLEAPVSTHAFTGRTAQLLIDGAWVDAASGKTFAVTNPATEEVIAHVAEGDAADVDRAVRAARRAFENPAWSQMKPMARERLMHRLADLLEAHADELAHLETLDQGKTTVMARAVDVQGSINRLRYCAGWPSKIEGRTLPNSIALPGEYITYVVREPVGVVGQIIPWNYPLMMAVGKIAPALAAGCTVVLKPAEQTPLTALRLGELVMEAGFPAGVVNIITGFGETAGAAIVDHPGVDKIAFTGSTQVGRLIGSRALASMKRVSLELGGKSPVIIGPDVDVDAAIKGASAAIFNNMGQVCVAGSRLFVADKHYDAVVEGVAELGSKLRLGDGRLADSQHGPLVSEEQMKRVLGYIEAGKAEGGKALTGGGRHGDKGWFVQPTVFAGLHPDSRLMREEIFGPVVVANKFSSLDDIEQIAATANDTEYGLAASIWTRDISFAHRLTRRIRAGTVWVNCHSVLDNTMPFGGFKQSGLGRENGSDGIALYTENKSVVIKV